MYRTATFSDFFFDETGGISAGCGVACVEKLLDELRRLLIFQQMR